MIKIKPILTFIYFIFWVNNLNAMYIEFKPIFRSCSEIDHYKKKFEINELMEAVLLMNESKIDDLIKSGVDLNQRCKRGFTALHYAIGNKEPNQSQINIKIRILERLLRYICVDSISDLHWTPLHLACAHGQYWAVKKLISFGADPYLITSEGYTACDLASDFFHLDIESYLLNYHEEIINNIEPNNIDYNGYTELMKAVQNVNKFKVNTILEYGKNLDIKTRIKGYTALHYAVVPFKNFIKKINIDILSKLIKVIDVDISSTQGFTALHIATLHNQLWAVKILIEEGNANHRLKTVFKQTALDIAHEYEYIEISNYLENLKS